MPASHRPEETADRIHGAAIRLLRFVRKEDAASGVPPAQLSALSVLVFVGPQTLSALAAAEQVTLPTMSQLVTALETKGLAARTPLDGRSVSISVTAKGKRLLEAARQRRLSRLTAALSSLPPEKLGVLRQAAEIIVAALGPRSSGRG